MMTCDDCIHKHENKELDEDFNATIHWVCSLRGRNIKLVKEYSELSRLRYPNLPLMIIEYDHSKKPCSDHKVGGVPLTDFMPKSNDPKNVTKLPERLAFLERE